LFDLQTVIGHLQEGHFFFDCLVFGGSEFILDPFEQALPEMDIRFVRKVVTCLASPVLLGLRLTVSPL
jgi:hypothetical protein